MSPSSRRLRKRRWPFARRRRPARAYPYQPIVEESYERERVREVVEALDRLWSATDYPEAHDISHYREDELKQFLGEWIHVRKAGNKIFEKIRRARPELPGWAPLGGEIPVERLLGDADVPPESPPTSD